MKISELSPDLSRSSGDRSIAELESLVVSAESISSSPSPSSLTTLAASLRRQLSNLSSLASFLNPARLRLWTLSFRLWNACVDISNANSGQNIAVAEIRHCSADLLLIAGIPSEIPSANIKAASFLHRVGLIWHGLSQLDRASECFEKATDLVDGTTGDEEERLLALELNNARSLTAWENSDKTLAIALLNRSKSFLSASVHPDSYKSLAEQYLSYGKIILSNKEGITITNANTNTIPNASDLFSEALNICEKALTTTTKPDSELHFLKQRCLRFLSAERLQNEDFEGVLKCVRVLRSSPQTPENPNEHPSVGYVAMKGWLGINNIQEAERELMGLVRNKEAPEGVVVTASEEYLGFAGVEAARTIMVALAGRCRVGGAQAAVRVIKRVLEGGGGKGRARAAAELATDDRVVRLFEGEGKGRERNAMHALLWNCGAEHFRMQNFEISAEVFERSMLYVLRDEENRSRRANCFRVLSLCHLALSQLDQAQEFINQADKLEPSIKCAFIKFKIHLKKKEEEEAIKVLESMLSYTDFDPEFLTISTHESLQNKFPKIATVSLSTLLSLSAPNKLLPMPEISIIRNLTTLLLRETGSENEILKYFKLVRTHMIEKEKTGTESNSVRETNWFAGNCWNLGLKMGKEMRYELCKEFYELGANFYEINFENDDNIINKEMACKCLILCVGAMLSLEENKKTNLSDLDVKKGIEMLNRASKLLPSISSDQSCSSFNFLHVYNSYHLLNKSTPKSSQQTQLIKSYASTKTCTPNHLLQLALLATQNPNPNLEAAELAFRSSLSSFLSLPSPDYASISLVLRKLVSIPSHNDDVAYEMYKQAYSIILGLRNGEYPVEEGKWLSMTAWNKSGLNVRLRQGEIAKKWMKLGLDFAKRLSGMEKYIKGMEDCLANFEKVCNETENVNNNSNSNSNDNNQLVLLV